MTTEAPAASDAVTLLPKNGRDPLTHTLDLPDDTLDVSVAGRDTDADEQFHVRVLHDGTPLIGETTDAEFFGAGVKRVRFVSTAARLADAIPDVTANGEDVADAIRDVLDAVRSQIAESRLVVVDTDARTLIEETEDVTFSPSGDGTWIVTFAGEDLDRREFALDRRQMTVDASAWADSRPPAAPDSVDAAMDGDRSRWRACRQVWTEMATVGDAPAASRPITEEVLRDRGTIPGTAVDVEEFERLAAEHDTLKCMWQAGPATHRQKDILEHAARELGLLDEFADVDGEVARPAPGTLF